MVNRLRDEIKQHKPFKSIEQEAFLNIVRTADFLSYGVDEIFRKADLSSASYNVLRILRGAGKDGLTCGEIGERMLTRVPDVTRILDRLEKRALIKRERQKDDRRVVKACIKPSGEKILASLEEPISRLHEAQLGKFSHKKLTELINFLEEVRRPE